MTGRRPQPPRPHRPHRPYWLLAVVAFLLTSPPAWAVVAVLAAAIAVTIARGAHVARGRQPEPAGSGVLLGADAAGEPVRLTDEQLSAHGLIVGATGAGKSTTLLAVLTDHIERGLPVVAIDMKGSPSFARQLASAAAAAKRPFRLWTPDGPGHWNPLAHGNPTELKDKLIGTERFTEPHYQRAAERYAQTALQVLEAVHPGRAPTLAEVVQMMDPNRLVGVVRGLPAPLGDRVHDYLATLTPDQVSAVRGLGTRLAIISESHTGGYLLPARRSDTIDLPAALNGEQVVLFSLNSSTYGTLSAQLGTLVVQDLIAAAGRRLAAASSPRALVGIDEFSGLRGDNVVALLARAREAGVSVVLATQELADLDRAARGLRDQVLGNTAVKIAHRQDVPASAQTIAQMSGTVTEWEESRQIGHHPLLGRHDTGRGTRRPVERFAIHPNEIRSLPTGRVVLITKLPNANARTINVIGPQVREGPERG